METRTAYWTQGRDLLNFGDALTDLFLRDLFAAPVVRADLFRLVGSCIAPAIIDQDRMRLAKPDGVVGFWCCGARSADPLPPSTREGCLFLGVRGPLTRDALGLPASTPLGDPGLLLPLIHTPSPTAATVGRTLCLPHINDPLDADALLALSGTDMILGPEVADLDGLSRLLDDIAGAEFVLSGSLHGAIIAAAYGRPFAFWDTGHVDVPFKWRDFAASIGHDGAFVKTLEEGRAHHARQALSLPPYAPILGCAPFAVRAAAWARALAADAGLNAKTTKALAAAAGTPLIESETMVAASRAPEPSRRQAWSDGVRAERRRGVRALQRLRDQLGIIEHRLASEIASQAFHFDDGELSFAAGRPGAAYLDDGWTTPNEVGPWSVHWASSLTLPPGLGWEDAEAVTFRGYLFAPHHPAAEGRRRVRVSIDDVWVFDEVMVNGQPDTDSLFVQIRCPIPDHVRDQGGGLHVIFALDPIGSPKALGLSPFDDRPIGFAPVAAVVEGVS